MPKILFYKILQNLYFNTRNNGDNLAKIFEIFIKKEGKLRFHKYQCLKFCFTKFLKIFTLIRITQNNRDNFAKILEIYLKKKESFYKYQMPKILFYKIWQNL